MKKGATLSNYNERDHFPSCELPLLDRFSQLAILASKQALEDSGLTDNQLDNTATIIGSGNGGKHRYCQLNLNYSDFLENPGSSKLRINTLQVYF